MATPNAPLSGAHYPASQFPGDLAQLHSVHFPARRRVITTFCSTKAPFPLAFLIVSCLLPHPPFSLCGHPLPLFCFPLCFFETLSLLHLASTPGDSHSHNTLSDLSLCPAYDYNT